MSFGLPLRVVRTASFGLALLYATLLAASAVILGFIVYWSVQASIDRQMGARIDAEIAFLRGELRSEGSAELTREVENRINYFGALEYFLADAQGKRLAGNLPNPPTTDGWSDLAIPDPQHGKEFEIFPSRGNPFGQRLPTCRRGRSRGKRGYPWGISRCLGLGAAVLPDSDVDRRSFAEQRVLEFGSTPSVERPRRSSMAILVRACLCAERMTISTAFPPR